MSRLPLLPKLLIVIAGPAVTLLLAWMSIQNHSMFWFTVALVVATGWALLQAIDSWLGFREEQTTQWQTNTLIAYLTENIQYAATFEYRIRDDPNPDEHFEQYRDDIEGWRTRTGDELENLLPDTGASQTFLAVPGQPGLSALYFEYSQLLTCQTALVSILGSVDSFVRRSRRRRAMPRLNIERGFHRLLIVISLCILLPSLGFVTKELYEIHHYERVPDAECAKVAAKGEEALKKDILCQIRIRAPFPHPGWHDWNLGLIAVIGIGMSAALAAVPWLLFYVVLWIVRGFGRT